MRPRTSRNEKHSLAWPHSGGDCPDKQRLARRAPRPGDPHPSGPPLAVGWRFPDTSGDARPSLRATYWFAALPLRLSSYFRHVPPFPVRRETSEAGTWTSGLSFAPRRHLYCKDGQRT